jgi:hypothetical protein
MEQKVQIENGILDVKVLSITTWKFIKDWARHI